MDLDLNTTDWPLDGSHFMSAIQEKSQLIQDGYRAGISAAPEHLEAKGLLFTGMGFSGICSNLVKDACTRALDTPFSVVKHYQFPHHVRKDWHTMAVSYSGATEETMAVAIEAKKRGVPITAFSTGGPLAELADHHVPQPTGYQPRAALGYAWFSILGYLQGSGLMHENVPVEAAAKAVAEVDVECGPHVPEDQNEAKQLARNIYEKIPQIYATPSMYGVGLHFRGMLNENAKKIAHVELVPECNHNDLTGWGDDPNRQHFTCLALSHADQNPEIKERLAFMRERYLAWGVHWHHHVFNGIHSFQDHIVEQARAIQMLDYASFYTAMLRGHDPSEIREIKGLKARLRGTVA
jgi:glucose/mannose-6-phosphate isomerase